MKLKKKVAKLIRKDAMEIGRNYLETHPGASLEEVGRHVKNEIRNRHKKGRYGFIMFLTAAAALLSIYVNVKEICEDQNPDPDFMKELAADADSLPD